MSLVNRRTSINITTPKFAAQAIRKAAESGWKPTQYLVSVSTSVTSVLKPAGFENAQGIISSMYLRDPSDPATHASKEYQDYAATIKKYCAGGDVADSLNANGCTIAQAMVEVLKKAGDNLTRENLMKVAANLTLPLPMLAPGITLRTTPDDFYPASQLQLTKFACNRRPQGRRGRLPSLTSRRTCALGSCTQHRVLDQERPDGELGGQPLRHRVQRGQATRRVTLGGDQRDGLGQRPHRPAAQAGRAGAQRAQVVALAERPQAGLQDAGGAVHLGRQRGGQRLRHLQRPGMGKVGAECTAMAPLASRADRGWCHSVAPNKAHRLLHLVQFSLLWCVVAPMRRSPTEETLPWTK